MRLFVQHVREWRTPLIIGAAVFALLLGFRVVDPTAARVTGALLLISAITKLISSR